MLCNVLALSTEVWRAKSMPFLLPSPVARSVSVTGSASTVHMQVSNLGYVVYTIYDCNKAFMEMAALKDSSGSEKN